MSKYDDAVNSHEINNMFINFEQTIKKIDDSKIQSLSPDVLVEYERLKRIVLFIKQEFSSCDPLLINLSILNNISSHMQYSLSHVSNFLVNGGLGDINQALIYIDVALKDVPFLFSIRGNQDLDGLKDSISNFRRSAGQYLSSVDREAKGLKGNISKLDQDTREIMKVVESQKIRLDNLISQTSEQFSNGENRRNEIISQGELKRHQDFLNTLDEKKKQFEIEYDKIKSGFDTLTQELKSTQNRFEDSLEKEAEASLEKIKDLLKHAEKITNLVSSTGMINGYQKYANNEKITAKYWQFLAVFSFGGLIGFGIYLFSIFHNQDIPFSALILRLLTVSTFLILGTYSAKQASKHERLERIYRKMELELSSINPYLACLADEERNKLIQHFATKYFGNIDKDDIVDDVKVFNPSDMPQQLMAAATGKKAN